MWFVISPAIYKGREACSHLNHGNRNTLSETAGSKLYWIKLCFIVYQARCLSREIYTGSASYTKYVLIPGKILPAKLPYYLHHCNIAGLFKTLRQCNHTMSVSFCTADFSIHYYLIALTVELLLLLYYIFFKTGCHRKRLKCRTRLVYVTGTVIFPYIA